MTSDGIFLVIPTHLHHDIALRGHVGRTQCFGESLPWGGGIQVLSPASHLAMRWDRGEPNPGRPLQEVPSSDHWLAPLWEIPFSCTEHSLHPRFPLIETQKEKCQAVEFKQKGLRQLTSHFSNFAVYVCKPHLFTCPVFVKVNSFGATT